MMKSKLLAILEKENTLPECGFVCESMRDDCDPNALGEFQAIKWRNALAKAGVTAIVVSARVEKPITKSPWCKILYGNYRIYPSFKKANKTNEIQAYHGIGAYCHAPTSIIKKQMLDGVIGVEVCASDRAIGAFGCVVKGQARAVFTSDCHSHIEGNARICDFGHELDYPTQPEFNQLSIDTHENASKQYLEAWITPNTITGLWVKEWAGESEKNAARIFAKNRNVALWIVSGNDRIYDLLPMMN